MKRQTARLSLLAAVLGISTPALSADWGGIKDYQANPGTPVPAPVPIPEFRPSWYFRFDIGVGTVSNPGVDDPEFTYGLGSLENPSDFRTSPSSWFDDDFDTFFTAGAGVGYYFGNHFRVDATIEKRSKDDVSVNGYDEWDTYRYLDADGNPATIGSVYTNDGNRDGSGNVVGNGIADARTRLTVSESTKLEGTLWLANAYYDLGTFRGFTPYVGGGIGFSWNEITRDRTQTTHQCNNETAAQNGCPGGSYVQVSSDHAEDKADKVTLAAAAMAGFSYQITDMTSVDIGYRYLFVQGTDAVLSIGGQQSRIEIGDQNAHQVRAGLRFDVD